MSKKKETPSKEKQNTISTEGQILNLNGFILMPYNLGDSVNPKEKTKFSDKWQTNFYYLLIFAINDAFYQNFINKIIRNYKPIKLERADTGAGLSVDLLDNVLRKIDNSHFCIADLSISNLNVSMEIGYALAKTKPVIQVNQIGLPLKDGEEKKQSVSNFSDLIGRLNYPVGSCAISASSIWGKLCNEFEKHRNSFSSIVPFFEKTSNKLVPFGNKDDRKYFHTFLGAWIKEHTQISDTDIAEFEKHYEENFVRKLYPAVCPVWGKLDPSGTEVEYSSTVFSSREEANFSTIFSNAKRKIRILTTNLQGLVEYLPNIREAQKNKSNFSVEILTLDPESEFVNARGALVGREIAEFRKEMKESLSNFIKTLNLKDTNETLGNKVFIRIYREFPTQITYIVDDYIYFSVVSVNHQSRNNIVFKIEKGRRGAENSFYQHWDTIWARANEPRFSD